MPDKPLLTGDNGYEKEAIRLGRARGDKMDYITKMVFGVIVTTAIIISLEAAYIKPKLDAQVGWFVTVNGTTYSVVYARPDNITCTENVTVSQGGNVIARGDISDMVDAGGVVSEVMMDTLFATAKLQQRQFCCGGWCPIT
jgi:hypothetical protein